MSAVLPRDAAPEAATQRDAKDKDKPSAAQRLAESRERLRLWMVHGDAHYEENKDRARAAAGGSHAVLDKLRSLPVIGVAVDAIAAWWEHHPLQPAASLAEDVVHDAVAPAARRHPFLVVAAAFVLGAAIVRFRPWRWLAKPGLFAGLLSQVVSVAVAKVPFESWLGAFASFSHARTGRGNASADTPDETAPMAEGNAVAQSEDDTVASPYPEGLAAAADSPSQAAELPS